MKSSSCDATKEPFIGNRKFQSCGEIESMHEFEFAELFKVKLIEQGRIKI